MGNWKCGILTWQQRMANELWAFVLDAVLCYNCIGYHHHQTKETTLTIIAVGGIDGTHAGTFHIFNARGFELPEIIWRLFEIKIIPFEEADHKIYFLSWLVIKWHKIIKIRKINTFHLKLLPLKYSFNFYHHSTIQRNTK